MCRGVVTPWVTRILWPGTRYDADAVELARLAFHIALRGPEPRGIVRPWELPGSSISTSVVNPGFRCSRDNRNGKSRREYFRRQYRYGIQRYEDAFLVFYFGHCQDTEERSDGPVFLGRLAGYLNRRVLLEAVDTDLKADCIVFV